MAEVAKCPKCGKPIDETHENSWCIKCGEPLPEEIKNRLPKVVALRNTAAAVAQPSDDASSFAQSVRPTDRGTRAREEESEVNEVNKTDQEKTKQKELFADFGKDRITSRGLFNWSRASLMFGFGVGYLYFFPLHPNADPVWVIVCFLVAAIAAGMSGAK